MNWSIWEKIFTYFYSKFRPVNCMHYIKCGVNSSLHNAGCCRRSVAPWITVLSWHSVLTIGVIYKFTLVWYSTKKGTMHMPISHLAHLHALPLLWPWEEQTAVQLGKWVRWSVFAMATLETQNILWIWVSVSNQHFTDGILLEFNFFSGYCSDTYNSLSYSHSSVWLDTVAVT